MKLNIQLIAHSLSTLKTYGEVTEFVAKLVDHLKAEANLPQDMAMISVGQDAPDQQYQDAPWLQTDEGNNPIALKVFNGSEWKEISPDRAVKGLVGGLHIQLGEYEIPHAESQDVWQDSKAVHQVEGEYSEFKFPTAFKDGTLPLVTITPVSSSVFTTQPTKVFEYMLADVTSTGFSIMTKHNVSPSTVARRFKFVYQATGEMEE